MSGSRGWRVSPWDRGRDDASLLWASRWNHATTGDEMNHRRLVGIDLGIASAHTVRVLDGEGNTLAKRKAWPTVDSLGEIEAVALAGTPAGTRLEVIVEPTGPAWLP